jgi:hypothetical protein
MARKRLRFSDQLRRAVDASGLSRYRIAKLLGVSESLLSRFMADSLLFSGKGKRRVSGGYVVESPIWKTTYRLVLGRGEDDKPYPRGRAAAEGSPRRGLAGGEDGAGERPADLLMDLYQPLDAPRAPVPVLKLQLSPSRGGDRQAPSRDGEEVPEVGRGRRPALPLAQGGQEGA